MLYDGHSSIVVYLILLIINNHNSESVFDVLFVVKTEFLWVEPQTNSYFLQESASEWGWMFV